MRGDITNKKNKYMYSNIDKYENMNAVNTIFL